MSTTKVSFTQRGKSVSEKFDAPTTAMRIEMLAKGWDNYAPALMWSMTRQR